MQTRGQKISLQRSCVRFVTFSYKKNVAGLVATALPHSLHHNRCNYRTVGQGYLFPVGRRQHHLSLVVRSQLFPHREIL